MGNLIAYIIGTLIGTSFTMYVLSGKEKYIECVEVETKIYCGRIVNVDAEQNTEAQGKPEDWYIYL